MVFAAAVAVAVARNIAVMDRQPPAIRWFTALWAKHSNRSIWLHGRPAHTNLFHPGVRLLVWGVEEAITLLVLLYKHLHPGQKHGIQCFSLSTTTGYSRLYGAGERPPLHGRLLAHTTHLGEDSPSQS